MLCAPVLAVGAADGAKAWATQRPQRAALLYRPWLAWLVAGAALGFGLLHNLPGAAGAWLAP